ncbi:sigma 54-interacting transcriptional regulator [Anaeroselena agilis]|uniref:Sigma 54-interacting transcriptional regulator n=1 Tax=Anaeroselena agilis TaxID=3063788 RepID=A0ABU3NT01_9FIRM|nr:sigma 54-interacting transcriptional regulator [Selenomonadales bacterium 4137-cl]
MHKIAIIGLGKGGTVVYQTLKTTKNVSILGVADIDPKASGALLAKRDGVFFTTDFTALLALPGVDIFIEATGRSEVREKLLALKPAGAIVMDGKAAELMLTILDEKRQLIEIKNIKGELDAILNSVQEGIAVAGMDGTVKYVNPSFVKISGISAKDRIGENTFRSSPDGALARCLRTRQPVFGRRSVIGGTDIEVVSNAAPILAGDKGEMVGAVAVFQPLTDVMRLMDQLQRQSRLLERLSVKFGEVTSAKYSFDDVLGADPALRQVVEVARKIADTNSTVLVMGESGTGKELIAHAIHNTSSRRSFPFIRVNCAAIPETLLESEFFGHEKGAFTGATESKMGKFELANRGTIFLDEIGDMPHQLQGKLLRVLQEREIERVGGTRPKPVDVRVIAATNRDLAKLIAAGTFREDLYYRLKVIELTIPPLRRRKEDIPLLVENALAKFNRLLGKRIRGFSAEALAELRRYDWPGNLRELENVVERAVVTTDGDTITAAKLGPLVDLPKRDLSLRDTEIMTFEEMERRLIELAVAKHGHNLEGKKQAAAALGISLATLYNKLRRYGLGDTK